MEKFKGISVFKGIAIGKIVIHNKKNTSVKKILTDDPERETVRFDKAKKKVEDQFKSLYQKALLETGKESAAIFDVYQMILLDPEYISSIYEIINQEKVVAEYAIMRTLEKFQDMFRLMTDQYIKERSTDIKDVSDRLISVLTGDEKEVPNNNEPYILLADDLSPSETIQMNKDYLLAFVTKEGSLTSHTAILAKTLGLPSLVKTNFTSDKEIEGKTGIVDGDNGILYIDPDTEFLSKMKNQQRKDIKKKDDLNRLKGKENVTTKGQKIDIFANIGGLSDLASVIENDAGGIGLLRSEFIYLQKNDFPTEEEQFSIYKKVAESMDNKKVIIRTLDIGADKQVDYFNLEKEDNPALGLRAIRICLERPEIFKTQLRAIYRASNYGNISIMYPMIISIDEIKKIKEIVNEVKTEFINKGIPFKDIEQGVMIETPASVIISSELSKEVDFFSIGTNDLTQYTLALDRQNPKLERFYDSHHPAVLKMIEMTVENGHKGGCKVGICGELAADKTLTERFINMGIDELSVSPSYVLELRQKVRSI